jgi:hypothetical protein
MLYIIVLYQLFLNERVMMSGFVEISIHIVLWMLNHEMNKLYMKWKEWFKSRESLKHTRTDSTDMDTSILIIIWNVGHYRFKSRLGYSGSIQMIFVL